MPPQNFRNMVGTEDHQQRDSTKDWNQLHCGRSQEETMEMARTYPQNEQKQTPTHCLTLDTTRPKKERQAKGYLEEDSGLGTDGSRHDME